MKDFLKLPYRPWKIAGAFEKQALWTYIFHKAQNIKKTNNIGPILDPITLNVQRKLEEIIEQKTDPNWTLKMLKLCYLKIYPAGQKTYSDSQYVYVSTYFIFIIIIFCISRFNFIERTR